MTLYKSNNYLAVELAVHCLSICIDKFESVASITIQMPVSIRSASVREKERHLVSGLWPQGDEVPEHVMIL